MLLQRSEKLFAPVSLQKDRESEIVPHQHIKYKKKKKRKKKKECSASECEKEERVGNFSPTFCELMDTDGMW